MSGAVAEIKPPTRACAQCGYDLGGLAGAGTPTCPECGATAGAWRAAYHAPWLVVPALRLLVWGVPSLAAVICITRFVDVVRGLPQFHGLIVYAEALLLYALPLAACVTAVGLLALASPGDGRSRAGVVGLAAFTIGCLGAALADHQHFREYWVGVGPARTVSYGLELSPGALAGRGAVLGAAALAVCCVALLSRLGSELGWRWFAVWRGRVTTAVAIAFLAAFVLRMIVQAVAVAGAQGGPLGGSIPGTAPRTWMDPVLLGLCAVVAATIWSLAFATLAHIRSMDDSTARGRR